MRGSGLLPPQAPSRPTPPRLLADGPCGRGAEEDLQGRLPMHPHALPVILVLPQSWLIGVIGSRLPQARCKVPRSLFKFILRILVRAGWEERIQDTGFLEEAGWCSC